MIRPVPIHHVGATVPDIDAAIDWYSRIMGFRLISGPFDLKPDPQGGDQPGDVLGPKLKHLRIAHMATGNGVGFELFEPIDPPFEPREHMVEFWRGGFFHICVTDPDVAGLAAKIEETGGQRLSQIWPDRPPDETFLMCYCADPFGNVLEIHSHAYEHVQGNR